MSDARIETNPEVMLGKPVVRGTRVTVELLLRKLSEGASEDDLLDAYPRITPEDLRAGPRFTIPIARIDHDTLFPGHRAILVSGRDYMGFNRLTTPPAEG